MLTRAVLLDSDSDMDEYDHILVYKQKVWKYRPVPTEHLRRRFKKSVKVSKDLINSRFLTYTDFTYALNTKLTSDVLYVIQHSDLSMYIKTGVTS